MRSILIAGAVLASVSAPALAQDDARAPFTGPHVEALTGYDHVGGRGGRDGVMYGGALGYDFQVGGAVLGIDGEAAGASTAGNTTNFAAIGDRVRVKADRDLYIGARAGVAVAPSTLLYVKGGYTNARFRTDYTSASGAFASSRNTLDGYRVGAGVEQKFAPFGPAGFVRAEYRYSHYTNLNAGGSNIQTDLDRHQAAVGLGIRF